ncbi:DUF2065 domain-containing protein [Niveibacterium sp. SC-1]|uniref:DUF2065 domain-containing protein n=1 Tax=Niveibacterium sp. SC-1 TaxID=3135646 RepID=UPI00311FE732
MLDKLLVAFALLLVLEGLLPFVAPSVWRRLFLQIARLAEGQIRFIGLTSILIGLVLLILFR